MPFIYYGTEFPFNCSDELRNYQVGVRICAPMRYHREHRNAHRIAGGDQSNYN